MGTTLHSRAIRIEQAALWAGMFWKGLSWSERIPWRRKTCAFARLRMYGATKIQRQSWLLCSRPSQKDTMMNQTRRRRWKSRDRPGSYSPRTRHHRSPAAECHQTIVPMHSQQGKPPPFRMNTGSARGSRGSGVRLSRFGLEGTYIAGVTPSACMRVLPAGLSSRKGVKAGLHLQRELDLRPPL